MDRGHQGVVSLKEMEHAVEQALVSTYAPWLYIEIILSATFYIIISDTIVRRSFVWFVVFQRVLFNITSHHILRYMAHSDVTVRALYLPLFPSVRAISLSQVLTQDWIWTLLLHLNRFVWNIRGRQLLMRYARVFTVHRIYVHPDQIRERTEPLESWHGHRQASLQGQVQGPGQGRERDREAKNIGRL